MLSHVSIGVKDLAKARGFYDATLKPLGFKCLVEGGEYAGYGAKTPELWLLAAKQPVASNEASGLHFCFDAASRSAVDSFHAAALQTGGRRHRQPGLRPGHRPRPSATALVEPHWGATR